MSAANHWRKALPYYLRASFRFSLTFWVTPLVLVLLASIWTGATTNKLAVNRAGLGLAIAFGSGFFLLALVSTVAADLYRNRELQERSIEWNPDLVWRSFLYLSALSFLVSAFLAYHQGAWLSVVFVCFAIGSAIVATVCFRTD